MWRGGEGNAILARRILKSNWANANGQLLVGEFVPGLRMIFHLSIEKAEFGRFHDFYVPFMPPHDWEDRGWRAAYFWLAPPLWAANCVSNSWVLYRYVLRCVNLWVEIWNSLLKFIQTERGNPRGECNKMAAVFMDLLTQKSTHIWVLWKVSTNVWKPHFSSILLLESGELRQKHARRRARLFMFGFRIAVGN